MDSPEQPAVWPPAPNVAPPEQEKAKSFKLMVPGWVMYWFRYGGLFVSLRWIVEMFCDVDHVPYPRWASFPAAMTAWLIVGGLITA